MAETLRVTIRQSLGKRNNRRLRAGGRIPAVLYGHGQKSMSLSVAQEELAAIMRHGGRLVSLQGDVQDDALLQQVQWDTYGQEVLHVDLLRVSATERVEMDVAVELRGEAIGAREGGIIEQLMHEVRIECPAGAIPERIVMRINDLKLGHSLRASDLALPENVTLINNPDDVVVHCISVAPVEEEAAEAVAAVEPELIRRETKEETDES